MVAGLELTALMEYWVLNRGNVTYRVDVVPASKRVAFEFTSLSFLLYGRLVPFLDIDVVE